MAPTYTIGSSRRSEPYTPPQVRWRGLSDAFDVLAQGLRRLSADDPDHGAVLAIIGKAFGFRFGLMHLPGNSASVVAFGEQSVAALPWVIRDAARCSANSPSATSLSSTRWAPSDLDAVIEHVERAFAETMGDASLAGLAGLTRYAYQARSGLGGAPSDTDAQIRHAGRGLALANTADPRRLLLHRLVAPAHERRYERAGDLGDQDAAIGCREAAEADGCVLPLVAWRPGPERWLGRGR